MADGVKYVVWVFLKLLTGEALMRLFKCHTRHVLTLNCDNYPTFAGNFFLLK